MFKDAELEELEPVVTQAVRAEDRARITKSLQRLLRCVIAITPLFLFLFFYFTPYL
jgi:hypothetical protein